MSVFYSDDAKAMHRLLVLQDMLKEQDFYQAPCPLLMSQLTEAEVLVEKMRLQIIKMQAITARHIANQRNED